MEELTVQDCVSRTDRDYYGIAGGYLSRDRAVKAAFSEAQYE